MRRRLHWNIKFLFLLVGILPVHLAKAQDEIPLPQEEEVPNPYWIQGIELKTDYLKFASLLLDTEEKYEAGVNVLLKHNFALSFEYGIAQLTPDKPYLNTTFITEGEYYKVGLQYRIPLDKKNEIFVGANYGQSTYDEKANFKIEGSLNDDFTENFDWKNLKANWGEIIIGSERKLFAGLRAGMLLRFRILASAPTFDPVNTYNIPGYGRRFNNTVPAVNLYLKYRINFKPKD
ncbi:DUF6048 family protein [Xanthovirga aplysinae]|uniref:DUF6048 family protein n=1 Tax=Xanthovirga aplysinae TaxID=2529853 RepID=UPI0012BBE001|nr:DUF6048 family protein [Xanthovirga aplysinae]MTI32359.1 hypothetical protein [Xanthovirga aplysinae]